MNKQPSLQKLLNIIESIHKNSPEFEWIDFNLGAISDDVMFDLVKLGYNVRVNLTRRKVRITFDNK